MQNKIDDLSESKVYKCFPWFSVLIKPLQFYIYEWDTFRLLELWTPQAGDLTKYFNLTHSFYEIEVTLY